MIRLKNVTKCFGRIRAVDGINLNIDSGRIFGLLGPNGAGKTTTIRIMLGIIKPDTGEIRLGISKNKNMYRHLGYLPEERGLYQKVRLKDILVFFGKLRGLSSSEACEMTNYWLDRFGLIDYSAKKVEELSKGNQQKVQFIIAVMHKPEILILDEPFMGLDPVNQILLKEIIQEFKRDDKTVVLSTHQMDQVEKLCDEICLIDKGNVILTGKLVDIKKKYRINKIVVDFESDIDEVKAKGLKILKNVKLEGNRLTGNYDKSMNIKDIIYNLATLGELVHFQVLEPSLEDIFIKAVSGSES